MQRGSVHIQTSIYEPGSRSRRSKHKTEPRGWLDGFHWAHTESHHVRSLDARLLLRVFATGSHLPVGRGLRRRRCIGSVAVRLSTIRALCEADAATAAAAAGNGDEACDQRPRFPSAASRTTAAASVSIGPTPTEGRVDSELPALGGTGAGGSGIGSHDGGGSEPGCVECVPRWFTVKLRAKRREALRSEEEITLRSSRRAATCCSSVLATSFDCSIPESSIFAPYAPGGEGAASNLAPQAASVATPSNEASSTSLAGALALAGDGQVRNKVDYWFAQDQVEEQLRPASVSAAHVEAAHVLPGTRDGTTASCSVSQDEAQDDADTGVEALDEHDHSDDDDDDDDDDGAHDVPAHAETLVSPNVDDLASAQPHGRTDALWAAHEPVGGLTSGTAVMGGLEPPGEETVAVRLRFRAWMGSTRGHRPVGATSRMEAVKADLPPAATSAGNGRSIPPPSSSDPPWPAHRPGATSSTLQSTCGTSSSQTPTSYCTARVMPSTLPTLSAVSLLATAVAPDFDPGKTSSCQRSSPSIPSADAVHTPTAIPVNLADEGASGPIPRQMVTACTLQVSGHHPVQPGDRLLRGGQPARDPQRPYVEYTIWVTIQSALYAADGGTRMVERRWRVARRFSQFVELEQELKERHGPHVHRCRAQLPSKFRLPSNMQAEGDDRMPQLNAYLAQVMGCKDLRRSEPLIYFIAANTSPERRRLWSEAVGSCPGS